MMTPDSDLCSFMCETQAEIAAEYERIRRRATEDPGTAGNEGEETWADLFRSWLPSSYGVVTKGRLLFENDVPSRQFDVIILRPSYPPKLKSKKVYLAGGVLAAFECKLTLKAAHIDDTVQKVAEANRRSKRLTAGQRTTPFGELYGRITFGLLAHSHCWKSPNSRPHNVIDTNLCQADDRLVKHPNEMLDLVCVSDVGTWSTIRHYQMRTIMKNVPFRNKPTDFSFELPERITTGYMYGGIYESGTGFIPVGRLIAQLLVRLAWEDPGLRSLADHFTAALQRGGAAQTRDWPTSVLSDHVLELTRQKRGGRTGRSSNRWDEFDSSYMEC